MYQRQENFEVERIEAAQLLEQRLENYANEHGIPVKNLKEQYDRYMLSEAVLQLTAMSKD